MTKFNSRQIESAMEFAKLMGQLGSYGLESFDDKYERTVKFIEKVNGIEDNMGEDKGLKVFDLEGGVKEMELSEGDFKAYDANGKLILHIPQDGKKVTFHGKIINNKDNDKNSTESTANETNTFDKDKGFTINAHAGESIVNNFPKYHEALEKLDEVVKGFKW